MAESFGNLARSHSRRLSNFAIREGAPGYCVCGKSTAGTGKGSRGFCSVDCRFWSKVQKGPGCWLWAAARHRPSNMKDLYGQVYYKGRPRRAHIVAWALSHGGILPDVSIGGLGVAHKCDVPLCVRPDHLFLATPKENLQDASKKGRLNVARPGRQKVSAEDIEVIRRRVAAGELHKDVAADFGIARNTLSEIVQGKRRQYDAPIVPAVEKAS